MNPKPYLKSYFYMSLLVGWAVLFAGCSQTPSQEAPIEKDLPFSPFLLTVNQLGYPTKAEKIATAISNETSPLPCDVYDLNAEKNVLSVQTTVFGIDAASDKHVHHADFSALETPGFYMIKCAGNPSYGFHIGNDLYDDLSKDALEYFYFHRLGEPILAEYLANPAHARTALHANDAKVPCFNDWCGKNTYLNLKGSWADAGDYGVYTVNHAISVWTLLNAYELNPSKHQDGQISIPENSNGIPDLLDEVRAGSGFVAGTLPAGGQLASHKVHNEQWTGYPLNIALENQFPRFAQPPSTAATYGVARVTAHLARLMAPYDQAYANTQWQVAQDAWQRAISHPIIYYTGDTPDSNGGGNYDDTYIEDDRYAAAVEMLITAKRLEVKDSDNIAKYKEAIMQSPSYLQFDHYGSQSWQSTHGTGSLSLMLHWDTLGLPASDKAQLERTIIASADEYIKIQNASGYPTIYNPYLEDQKPWEWGSNSFVVNNMIVMAYAYKISNQRQYLASFYRVWDYLLGNNALNLSFVTGYGTNAERDTLDGHAWTLHLKGIPYPSGWLSGGPMNAPASCVGEPQTDLSKPPALAYGPSGPGSRAWCSKENTVNWNAPLYWVAKFAELNPLD